MSQLTTGTISLVSPKLPALEWAIFGGNSRYSFQNSRRSDNNNSYYFYVSESLYLFTKCSGAF